MSEQNNGIGSITWQDLTVPNADEVKEFYSKVAGWEASEHDMGDYCDYNIKVPGTDKVIAGICHARGTNANIPPQWLIYISVEDVNKSAEQCTALGGKVIDGPRKMGHFNFCVIQDPAGAVAALISK
ncbi:MAG: VOC family protein [Ignavibacteriae bacterium]|nr:MAG: VOC family protein [Ignavibacteriota bacterium]